jgi:hypothetical protein
MTLARSVFLAAVLLAGAIAYHGRYVAAGGGGLTLFYDRWTGEVSACQAQNDDVLIWRVSCRQSPGYLIGLP